MRKLIILLFFSVFMGCEKYEQPTQPKLSGQWVIDGVTFPSINSNQVVLLSDTVIVSDRQLSHITSNGIGIFTHNWKDSIIPWHDKFIIGKTVWEFDYNKVGLPDRDYSGSPFLKNWDYYEIYPDLFSSLSNKPIWDNLEIKSFRKRNYTIDIYGMDKVTLILPSIYTMYRYNGETYFLRENIRLIFRKLR